MTYKAFDVVAVPFPFTESNKIKKRPAVILSSEKNFNQALGQSVMAMITSAKNSAWPNDVAISDLKRAGLSAPSVVRLKIFTLDHRLVSNKIGELAESDRMTVMDSFRKAFEGILP